MYKKETIRSRVKNVSNVPVTPFECDHSFKPFSYYLNGGNDPTGEHTDLSCNPSFDSAEDIANNCPADGFSDPRVGFFDIVEKIGFERANSISNAVDAGEKEDKK